LIDHPHNTQIVGVVRKAKLTLIKSSLKLQGNVIFSVWQKKELGHEEKIQQEHQNQKQTDNPTIEPALLGSTELPSDSLFHSQFLLLDHETS
jgi:hypothetical protein